MDPIILSGGLSPLKNNKTTLHMAEQEPSSEKNSTPDLAAPRPDAAAGDQITISAKGKTMAAAQKQQKEESEEVSAEELALKQLKQQIEKIKEEIREAQQSDLPPKEKQQKIMRLQQELAQYTDQLNKMLKKGSNAGNIPAGGTPAQTFPNSLT
ncbi:MAG: hypothetical protein AB7D47_10890 [Desulfovibrio sp.]|jgi:predicted RNase H-like nuclease (RuvC/YqgF family)